MDRTLGALVLAGGLSQRMGQDKASLTWQGEPFLNRICRLLKAVADPIVIVARRGQLLTPPEGTALIEDRQSGVGPLMGLATGLIYLAERGIPWAFVTTCDAPRIVPQLATRLWELAEDFDAAVPVIDNHVFGLTSVYRTAIAHRLFELLESGYRRVRDLPQLIRCRTVAFAELADIDPRAESFQNVNTADDYVALLATNPSADNAGDHLTSAKETDLASLGKMVAEFVLERQWTQFHSPKNLSMSLAIEAAELMEHFQWLTTEQSREVRVDSAKKSAVAEEMSDVFCYLLALANELDVDLAHALRLKMDKNRRKYPVDCYRGRYGPTDPNPPAS